jgi:hypothetical protein
MLSFFKSIKKRNEMAKKIITLSLDEEIIKLADSATKERVEIQNRSHYISTLILKDSKNKKSK